MDIFGQLGINATAAVQFIFFAIALIFLNKFVFTPYSTAFEKRHERTKGGEDLAVEFHSKAVELQAEYESKLRVLNLEIKSIIDEAKTQATKGYEQSVSKTRFESEELAKSNRARIGTEIQQTQSDLRSQTANVAMAITSKLLK